jgi:small GTP-binding protein
MSGLSCKICILGDFAVGKTSTVERFVNNQFSEKYLTTIGVKVDTKDVHLDHDVTLKMVLWDVAGTDRFGELEFSYLRGASGYIFVADGTRSDTAASVGKLRRQSEDRYGPLPCVLLLNKSDLTTEWDISSDQERELREEFTELFVTSAKTGDNVNDALTRLGQAIAAREFPAES